MEQVYVNFQNAQALFKWAESMRSGAESEKPAAGKLSLRSRMKTAVTANNATSSKILSDVLVKNNLAVVVSFARATACSLAGIDVLPWVIVHHLTLRGVIGNSCACF